MLKKIGLNVVRSVVVGALALCCMRCGSASSDSTGASLALTGFFMPPASEDDELCTVGAAGGVFILSSESDEAFTDIPVLYYYIKNLLEGQTVILQAVHIKYEIPGSVVEPPENTEVMATMLAPGSTSTTTSLPPAGQTAGASGKFGNESCYGFFIVPPALQSWFIQNKHLLPPRPFMMTMRTSISGQSSAGQDVDTNELTFPIWVDDLGGSAVPTVGAPIGDVTPVATATPTRVPTATPTL